MPLVVVCRYGRYPECQRKKYVRDQGTPTGPARPHRSTASPVTPLPGGGLSSGSQTTPWTRASCEQPFTMTVKRACAATTKKGEPCKAAPLEGRDVCLAHADEETRESTGFGGPQENAGRPPLPKVTDLLREKVEERADEITRALFDALAADKAVTISLGRGETSVDYVTDHAIRITAARELLDRVYGKPKQTQELSGPDGGPIDLSGTSDAELLALRDQLARKRS